MPSALPTPGPPAAPHQLVAHEQELTLHGHRYQVLPISQDQTKDFFFSLSSFFAFFGLILLIAIFTEDPIHVLVKNLNVTGEASSILQYTSHSIVSLLQHLATLSHTLDCCFTIARCCQQ